MPRLRLVFAALAALAGPGLAGPSWADEPKAAVDGVADKALRQAIARYIGTTKKAPLSHGEARRRAEQAAEDAVVVLRSEGYYDYAITPDVTGDDKPQAVLRIDPGPRFVIADPKLAFAGVAPGAKAQTDAAAAVKLKAGQPGRAAEVVAAEGRVVGALKHDGYADAAPAPREVIVDHADRTVRPTFNVDAKALVRLDGVKVESTGRTNPKWVAGLAPWRPGDVYAPDPVAELERRLLDTGVYNSVGVALAPESDSAGLRPVVVSLADRRPASIALGGSYSTSEGAGVNARLTLYNRLRRADTITFSVQYADILKRVDGELSLPDWHWPQWTLRLGWAAYEDNTDAFEERDAGVHADLDHRLSKTSFATLGIAADYANDNERILENGQVVRHRRKLALLTGLARLSLDRSNDPLDPTQGWKIDGRVEPTLGTGDTTLVYAKTEGQVSGYLPFGPSASTVLAGRAHIGVLLSASPDPDILASRRFYAGGAGSIRGYAYQAVGPRFPDNSPIGGESLWETSVELRQRIGARWGAVAFLDAGTVSAQKYPDFKTYSAGAGIGLRYNLGFAPIRADIGFPLNRRTGDAPFQIYLSIGQSF